LGIVIVLVFVGLPFVVRTVQPVLESLEGDTEEAAAMLGANRWQTMWRVLLPALQPSSRLPH
jgi:sulfate transport system permease protein